MSDTTRHSIAMITAWMTSSVELMDSAVPPSPTIDRLSRGTTRPNETLLGIRQDYEALRDVTVELSLLCATAISCWANSIGLDPETVLRDIAVNTAEYAAEHD